MHNKYNFILPMLVDYGGLFLSEKMFYGKKKFVKINIIVKLVNFSLHSECKMYPTNWSSNKGREETRTV